MTDTPELEPAAIHAPGSAPARYAAAPPEEYRTRFVMDAAEAKALDDQLRACMRAILTPGVDYGTVPGMGTKPSLFKPGAEKLLQWFGFGFVNERDEIERAPDGSRVGVTYRCTVFKEMNGRRVTVATCDGYAGYDEDKFLTSAEANEARERANAQRYKREPNPAKFAEYRAPWNSLLKMAHKRAMVGAVLDATGAASLFTQDLEDMRSDAAPADTAFTDAADAAIRALPEPVRDSLDRWYRGKRWPSPDRWSAEQWVAALQEAGRLDVRNPAPDGTRAAPAPAPPAPPAPPPAPAAPASPQGGAAPPGWSADDMIASATAAPDRTACSALWKQAAAAAKAGLCTPADAKAVQDILLARLEDLKREAVPGLSPDDPWAVKIEGIATAQEAEKVTAEVLEELRAGRMDEARATVLQSAVASRTAQAAGVIEGKAAA